MPTLQRPKLRVAFPMVQHYFPTSEQDALDRRVCLHLVPGALILLRRFGEMEGLWEDDRIALTEYVLARHAQTILWSNPNYSRGNRRG